MVDESRSVRIEGAGDGVRVSRLEGREWISRLFEFELTVHVDAAASFDPGAVVGSEVDVVFTDAGVEQRRVHGMVSALDELSDAEGQTRTFLLVVSPRAFRLTFVESQEVYLDRSIPEIVAEKLELCGLGDALVLRLAKTYPKKEFVTQYKESDLAFVSRLLEHEGISFSFAFDADKGADVMVLTDSNGAFDVHEPRELAFEARGDRVRVRDLAVEHRLAPATYVVQDYNYRRPLLDLSAEEKIPSGYGGGVVEYGTHHKTQEEGKELAKIRAEERHASTLVYRAVATVPTLAPATRVSVTGHRVQGDLDLVVTEVHHRFQQIAHERAAEAYTLSFRAIPADRTFRPARRTARPKIHGVVSGIVDDATRGVHQYAQLDTEGRYIVKLLHDTADSSGKLASRWIRMAQPHTGPDYGMHFPLKPGIEVLLAFIDGDPDRPIIVGAAPNPVTRSPSTPPATP
ncbi:MAG: type VI secretion system tip protein TssI/VgrG [Polyangiaceae bacterium]